MYAIFMVFLVISDIVTLICGFTDVLSWWWFVGFMIATFLFAGDGDGACLMVDLGSSMCDGGGGDGGGGD